MHDYVTLDKTEQYLKVRCSREAAYRERVRVDIGSSSSVFFRIYSDIQDCCNICNSFNVLFIS